MAAALGITQQRYASYEAGTRRIQVSMIPALAQALMTGTDALLSTPAKLPPKHGPTLKFQQHLERIGRLPKAEQRIILQMLEGVLVRNR